MILPIIESLREEIILRHFIIEAQSFWSILTISDDEKIIMQLIFLTLEFEAILKIILF